MEGNAQKVATGTSSTELEQKRTFTTNLLGEIIGALSPVFSFLFRQFARLVDWAVDKVTNAVNRIVTDIFVSCFRIIIQLAFLVLVFSILVQSVVKGFRITDSQSIVLDASSHLKTALFNFIPVDPIIGSTKLFICHYTGWCCNKPPQNSTETITSLTATTIAEVGAVSDVIDCITGLTQIRLTLLDMNVHPLFTLSLN